ncbi:haloacid dehalogenase [Actinomycetota bacterium]|nr:haloacid dehalogenase [Actinomycetota bacterium]
MLAVVALFVLTTGELRQALFMLIIVINAGIGIVTEVKAKITLDKLQLLIKEHYIVLRNPNPDTTLNYTDFQRCELLANELQVDDVVNLSAGSQIPADGVVIEGDIEVNESALTGESHNISKVVGAHLMSGTSVVVGHCLMRVEAAGEDAYVMQLSKTAKKFKMASSDLRDGINKILKYISFGIIPVAVGLVLTQAHEVGGLQSAWETGEWRGAVLAAAAGIVGMIPEGLVLLTSLNFALAAIILARQNVLVAELNSVETLARVDELVLDKTGTITDGTVEVVSIIPTPTLGEVTSDILIPLHKLVTLPGGTTTSEAIGRFLNQKNIDSNNLKVQEEHSFDSAKKCSSITVEGVVYQMGAPEIIAPDLDVRQYTNQGLRVLTMTKDSKAVLVIICREHIRENAAAIVEYFKQSGVNVQIVSGDNEATVRQIGSIVGIDKVVGRAKPETKLEIVRQLQANGKVVAMTGDGVNDILALKEADLGIAMQNAAPASKMIANIVLLDSDFGNLPAVVGQGRRVIANIERVASLFLVKTVYSILLSLITIVLQMPYPFTPIQQSLVSALCIGIPAFFLALPPNNTVYRKGFLRRVLRFSVPFGAAAAVLVIITANLFPAIYPAGQVVVLAVCSFVVLALKSKPLLSWRGLMLAVLVILFVLPFFFPFTADFFNLTASIIY